MKKVFIILSLILFIAHHAEAGNFDHLKKATYMTYNAEFDKAEKFLIDYIQKNPQDPLGYILAGLNYDWKQQSQDLGNKYNDHIIELFERGNLLAFIQWDKDQDNVDKMVILGNSYMYLSKKWLDMGKKMKAGLILKKCKKYMEKAIEKDPNRYDAHLAIGIFNYYAANIPSGLKFIASLLGISGDEKLGLEQMKKAALNDNIFQADALFMLTYTLGRRKGDYQSAKPLLDKLVKLYPDNGLFRYYRGSYAFQANQHQKTREYYDDFLNFCQKNECPGKYLFYAHFYQAESFYKQKSYYAMLDDTIAAEKLMKKDLSKHEARLELYKGYAYQAKGKHQFAKKAFQNSLKSEGSNDEIQKKAKAQLNAL